MHGQAHCTGPVPTKRFSNFRQISRPDLWEEPTASHDQTAGSQQRTIHRQVANPASLNNDPCGRLWLYQPTRSALDTCPRGATEEVFRQHHRRPDHHVSLPTRCGPAPCWVQDGVSFQGWPSLDDYRLRRNQVLDSESAGWSVPLWPQAGEKRAMNFFRNASQYQQVDGLQVRLLMALGRWLFPS